MDKKQKLEIKGLIRQVIVLRDGEYCLRCGSTQKLQMSHIFSVGAHKKLEYDWDNIKFLCYRCHFHWWHKNPMEASEWIRTVINSERYERLKLFAYQSNSKGVRDYNTLKIALTSEIKRLEHEPRI